MEKKREDLKKGIGSFSRHRSEGKQLPPILHFLMTTTESWKFPIVRLRHPIVGYTLQSPFPVDL